MKESIQKLDLEQEYYTEENCHITEVSNGSADPDLSIARARVEPGVTTSWHRLRDTTERYVIISGTGRAEVGDMTPQEVAAGDVVIIPPLCPQRISNTGADDLIFLAICSPRFTTGAYEDIGTGLE
jgi:mannose-6-phosphate isomerase-like protein (cupin superfamily)